LANSPWTSLVVTREKIIAHQRRGAARLFVADRRRDRIRSPEPWLNGAAGPEKLPNNSSLAAQLAVENTATAMKNVYISMIYYTSLDESCIGAIVTDC
jgi:hypothetical protein